MLTFLALFALTLDPEWVVDRGTSALDGRSHYVAMKAASDEEGTTLALSCAGRLRVVLTSADFVQGTSAEISWSIDGSPAERASGEVLTRGAGVALDPETSDRVMSALAESSQAVFRIGSGEDVTFATGGAAEHVAAARALCSA